MYNGWGERSFDLYDEERAGNVRVRLLWWQRQGLSYTVSGYGFKIPTSRVIRIDGRWRRVYCTIYGNSGTCWVIVGGQRCIVA